MTGLSSPGEVRITEDLLLETLRKHPGIRTWSLTALALGLNPHATQGNKARLIERNRKLVTRLLCRLKAKGKVRHERKKWYPEEVGDFGAKERV